jgi:hypothetical protein
LLLRPFAPVERRSAVEADRGRRELLKRQDSLKD